ncbi:MAG: YdcF family protein [Candidatus Aminicenantes bacterium]|nr:MAG: YdcF family protein [Candidatus Aminicenantes bacterium]
MKLNSVFLKKKYIFIGLVLLGGIALFVFRGFWLMWIGDFLVLQDNLHPGDVIHVIAGEDYRTDHAIQLYKQGYGKMLFFTGGWCRTHGYNHGEHAEVRAVAQGIPMKAIAYDDSSVNSTFMEILKLDEWISHLQIPIHSVVVVSDPFHMRRARWAYKKVLGDGIEVQMAPVPFERTPYRHHWWTDRESRKFVREEYEKYVYYVLRYQISRGKFQDWLASLDRE